jgi:hypothetical protein
MIIITRCTESTEWINIFKDVLIIDLGTENYKNSSLCCLFEYIIKNYDTIIYNITFITLCDTFIQDTIIQNLLINKINECETSNKYFEYISFYKKSINLENPIDTDDPDYNDTYINDNLKDIYINLFGNFEKEIIYTGEGDSFFISKDAILSRSKQFYEKIYNMLNHVEYPLVAKNHDIISILIEKIFTNTYSDFEPISIIEDDTTLNNIICYDYDFKSKYIQTCKKCLKEYKINPTFMKYDENTIIFCSLECKSHYNDFCMNYLHEQIS